MAPLKSPLFCMESPIPSANCRLHLLEPPTTCTASLWKRLFEGTYDKPFIIDSGERRSLHFDLHAVQSEMHLRSPDRLALAYTRKMMAFLLFNRNPARILLLGLGGGSLAKFCYRYVTRSRVTVIEVNPDVIALREEFRIPQDDERLRVICANGAAYLEHDAQPKDVILIDACDREGVAPELNNLEFYSHAHQRLTERGVLVANLCADLEDNASHLRKIRATFGEDVLTLRVRPDGNLIVIAPKRSQGEIDWLRLETTAVDLKREFGLNFPRYTRRIALNWKLSRWERAWT